MQILKNGIVTH